MTPEPPIAACPFCGSAKIVFETDRSLESLTTLCTNCGANAPVNAWDRRAAQAPQAEPTPASWEQKALEVVEDVWGESMARFRAAVLEAMRWAAESERRIARHVKQFEEFDAHAAPQAMAKAEPPVAYLYTSDDVLSGNIVFARAKHRWNAIDQNGWTETPLYAAPAAQVPTDIPTYRE